MTEYRIDIYAGPGPDGRPVGSEYYDADNEQQVSTTGRRLAEDRGGNYGDIYEHNGVGGATYYDTVEVD